jgi:hypothetical protein
MQPQTRTAYISALIDCLPQCPLDPGEDDLRPTVFGGGRLGKSEQRSDKEYGKAPHVNSRETWIYRNVSFLGWAAEASDAPRSWRGR